MTTTHAQTLPQPTVHPISRAVAAVALTCALLIAIVALAMSLVAINRHSSTPGTPAQVAAVPVANVPACPLHGRC